MIVDDARKVTDKRLARMERRIEAIYKEAQSGIQAKWDKYMANAAKRVERLEAAYTEAKKAGDAAKIAEAEKRLKDAKKNITIQDKHYQEMVEETARQISSANQTAIAYVNGQMPSVYAVNYNQGAVDAEKVGMKFTAVNEGTVRNLITNQKLQLPYKKLDLSKDIPWNMRQINSSVLQGILQGERIEKIAERIKPIIGNNAVSAVRTARTAVTGAENIGRLDSYKDLEERGAIQRKVWIATPDDRTREWHLEMDGQEVPIDSFFTDGNGNELDYPGDPGAAPETVYNCRCSMRTHIIGFRKADGRIEYLEKMDKNTFHNEQIEEERKEREKEKKK